ncbi:2-C-methyl-D-erythritol 4-phosphate cytidylyltransferase [Actinomyces weissii]|uniref:2-C-methyl-D-erythritol 4-phosphate cytidylyltransferase n=1 Tax=Actinomyces weissii TaxID=675090 RepID=A0A7T7S2Y3_9ACTO|nr:2-C-methyl-D-erythritol 4-phosphate cytidylyltransferase [Actinomyces weissii]QQM67934.1 2-C-methyl-D-erythritol 4-phosphate cytidylyltransferase [Actinomyces weissii]
MSDTNTVALIFAGGVGERMKGGDIPKQFLKVHGKEIIVHTIGKFQQHQSVDAIVVVCVQRWVSRCAALMEHNGMDKVRSVIAGGATGQESIRAGLEELVSLGYGESVVLVHDGVRPFIDATTISSCIESARMHGSAVTSVPCKETVLTCGTGGEVRSIPPRDTLRLARAPQCFVVNELVAAHDWAEDSALSFVDSASLMIAHGHEVRWVEGPVENIKITTPDDFFMMRAILDARENGQLYMQDS